MKLIRHLTPSDPPYAALQPDGSAREVTGAPLPNTHCVNAHTVFPAPR